MNSISPDVVWQQGSVTRRQRENLNRHASCVRERVRKLVGDADFIEIYRHCPLEVCEERDVKGLYRKARQGLIRDFTGISSLYEEPEQLAYPINTARTSVADSVGQVLDLLVGHGKARLA